MKAFFIAWMLLLSGDVLAQQAVKLSLEEVVERSRSQSIAARQATATRETRYWEYRTYLSNYKPQLMLNGNLPAFTRSFTQVQQPDGTILFQPVRNNNSSLSLSLSQQIPGTGGTLYATSALQRFDDFDRRNTLYSGTPVAIGYTQPLFQFNALRWDRRIEPLKYRESQQAFKESIEQIAVRANTLYFDLLLAQVNLQIAETNLKNTGAILRIADEKLALGKTTRNEILQLQLEQLKAQKAAGTARRDVEVMSLGLKAYTGLPATDRIELLLPAAISQLDIDSAVAIRESFENRADAIGFHRRMEEAERLVAKARGDNSLNAMLTATLGFSNRGGTIPDLYRRPQDQQTLQIEFGIPVLDWGRSKSRLKTAQVTRQLTEYTVEQDRQTFRQEVHTQVTLFEMLRDQLSLTRQADSIATEKYQIAQERYVLGKLTITELSIAFAEKDQAKRDYVYALRDLWGAYYQLRALTLYDFETQRKIP